MQTRETHRDDTDRACDVFLAGTRAPVPSADLEAAAGERVDAGSAARPGGSMRR